MREKSIFPWKKFILLAFALASIVTPSHGKVFPPTRDEIFCPLEITFLLHR
jgi:hypothetical protein